MLNLHKKSSSTKILVLNLNSGKRARICAYICIYICVSVYVCMYICMRVRFCRDAKWFDKTRHWYAFACEVMCDVDFFWLDLSFSSFLSVSFYFHDFSLFFYPISLYFIICLIVSYYLTFHHLMLWYICFSNVEARIVMTHGLLEPAWHNFIPMKNYMMVMRNFAL